VSDQTQQSRVLTLVFTDLADSTALKAERGDVAVGDIISRHREHVAELARRCRGSIVDWAGDGCFLTFETSSEAVTFGLRLQQIHHYEDGLPGVRIGIHMGEVSTRPFDGSQRVEGLAVDLAARISGLAQPGQVLLSSAVQQNAKQRLGIHEFGQPIRWEGYGAYTLKGFDEPVDIREAGLDPIAPFTAPPAGDKAWPASASKAAAASDAGPAPIRKLAVLPLTNFSGDAQQEFFVDGMTEAVITELAKIKALRVISRTSVMRYKGTTRPLTEIAAELGVDALVEGSVLRAGNDVRITAQLIRGDSDEHMWAEHYDGTVENILKLQKDIALAVADEVQVAVTADEREELRTAKRIDPQAYDLFLKAARFGGTWTPASIRQSLDVFQEVQRLAPDFGRVYTMQATAYYFMGMSGYASSAECFSISRRAGRRALRIDDHDDGAHTVLGWIALAFEWDWDEALYRLERARAINPTNHFIYSGLGFLHAVSGRPDEALRAALQGVEIDPNNPPAHHNLGLIKFLRRDYDGALEKMRDAVSAGRNVLPPHVDGALIAACAGQHDIAREFSTKAVEMGGPQPHFLAYRAYAHARVGERAEAQSILQQLESYSGPAHVLYHDIAIVNIALGRVDAALDALEHAHRDREYYIVLIGVSPVFDPLREEPRFRRLIDKLDYPAPGN
jgi:TolB-like protein/class 3 adenylate cyclase/Flp pilus assembly protein TadD